MPKKLMHDVGADETVLTESAGELLPWVNQVDGSTTGGVIHVIRTGDTDPTFTAGDIIIRQT